MKIPDLIGKKIDEAKEILSKKKIKYFDETKTKLTIKETSGKVVKVEEKDGKLVIYESKNILLILLMVLAVLVLGFGLTFGNGIFNSIKDNILETNIITKPKITEGSKDWVKEALISIEEDSRSKKKIDYYEYCVIDEEDSDKCEWKRTDTKNVRITHTGHHYVFIRAVDEEGRKGREAETEVFIDNNAPIVADLKVVNRTKNSIRVEIYAKDDESGINKYLYSLDGINYVEGEDEYTFTNLEEGKEYKVYAKVIDRLGNEKIVSILTRTLTEEEAINQEVNPEVITDENGNVTVPDDNTSTDPNGNTGEEDNWDIPQIDLIDLPASFEYSSEYVLPSNYSFGNDTGSVVCQANGKEVNNTKELLPGKYLIVCTATSSHNKSVTVDKRIEVTPSTGSDELLDGWIRLNLYYPENSTNWEWRLDGENGIRTGYDGEGWTPYTGPILVKVEDIENIYIRYNLNGETYIIAPNGKLVVDIEPDYYEVAYGKVTNVRINYDKTATVKKYRVNGGSWEPYTGPFEVGPGTKIEALVEKEENVYDNHGNQVGIKRLSSNDAVYIKLYENSTTITDGPGSPPSDGKPWKWCEHYDCTPWGDDPGNGGTPTPPRQPSTYLEGPIISSNPNTGTVEYTTVTVTPQETARTIYYAIGSEKYKEYTGPFEVTNNTTIRAYYIRESDGKKSDSSYYEVNNIKLRNLPYIKITATPSNYLSEDVNSVAVSITGSDYDGNIEYSYDGEIYQTYTGPLTIIQSSTVYARATNQYGTTVESKTIRTITPAVPKDTLDVLITADPSKNDVVGLIGNTTITINYDSRATKKYYKLAYYDSWKEYTGPFVLTSNATVYAYCTSSNGSGEDQLSIDYLTTGISSPIITLEPASEPTQVVKVTITFDKNAVVKKYKLGNGNYINYTGPIYLMENTTITAMNKDVLDHEAASKKTIKNVIIPPTIIDKGGYYIIRLNYPDVSEADSRQYKWKENGSWRIYDPQGILLIKEGINLPDLGGGYQVEDDRGNTLVFKDHYYQLDCPISEIYENLFMRWDNSRPQPPTILVDTTESTKEVTVSINYDSSSVKKYYKTVTVDGIDSGWKEYTGSFKIVNNNVTIYAKGINRLELESNLATKKITNIDENEPELSVIGNYSAQDDPKQKVAITVKATDDVALDMIKWTKGTQTADYFLTNGNIAENNTQVVLTENGEYTFYAVDKVGNSVIQVINVENVDTNAPTLNIIDRTASFGIEAQIEIEYEDSDTKQYSIGNDSNYQNYTGIVTIKAEDVYQLANSDGSLTIYAKGKDKAGNVTVVSENIYTLDLDMMDAPIINGSIDYPTLTTTGFETHSSVSVQYAARNDITNYIDIANGEGWIVYTGAKSIVGGTIKAKSVKNSTGLTSLSTKEITAPSDALKLEAYDGRTDTDATIAANTSQRFNVSTDGAIQIIKIKSDAASGSKIKVYGVDGTTVVREEDIISNNMEVRLPSGASKVEIIAGSVALNVAEIELGTVVETIAGDSILSIVSRDLDEGYYAFEVNGEIYPVHLYVLNGNQTITENTQYGNSSDVGTANTYAENMVIVKVKGDYTVDSGVTVEPIYTQYGGPKGFLLYVTGKLTNNGTINNDHGAYAENQDVYLWKNTDTTYETIPGVGSTGGAGFQSNASNCSCTSGNGRPGNNGVVTDSRATAGGGSGYGHTCCSQYIVKPGGTGTSYSGGVGSGYADGCKNNAATSNLGGAGGSSCNSKPGAGNPSGGTGGLLVIYSDRFENNGTLTAKGANSSGNAGASGGGSVNIFTNQSTDINSLATVIDTKYGDILGQYDVKGGTAGSGGAGGEGTINIGEIRNGQYYDLKTIIEQDIDEFSQRVVKRGDSILSILEQDLSSGYWIFRVNDGTQDINYPVHLYVLNGNQTITENTQYGVEEDCATGTTEDKMAKAMVIVKVNGNYTVDSGVTVGPVYTQYGGPKGFLLYVTGKLTNNGTIDNSHGAYANGQNVYLWKNALTNDYEVIPAAGATGGPAYSSASGVCSSRSSNGSTGNNGSTVSSRATAGGGTGAGTTSCNQYHVQAGGTGTSYSGGVGSGYASACWNNAETSNVGGAGGSACSGTAGVGNPSGGTGGLLVIYSDSFENNGTLTANGTASSGNAGASGAGSINIFTNQSTNLTGLGTVIDTKYDSILGQYQVNGGSGGTKGGSGGLGTINIGEIRENQYYDLKDIIQQDIDAYEAGILKTGDSILSILETDIESGYWLFRITTDEETVDYPVHLYVLDGNQTITENTQYGDEADCATGTTEDKMAKNMVIVKVKGNYTVNEDVTVGPVYTNYGGPRGFLLYVTGTLTNNGIIDNSHGAYAEGQNVYLWKNTDNTYEVVPAAGNTGGAGFQSNASYCSCTSGNGRPGNDGALIDSRATGGGGSGYGTTCCSQYIVKQGGTGTSYSGGSGSGSASGCKNNTATSNVGGAGGSSCASNPGVGNPSGGTGGLLIIYTNNLENSGTLKAVGTAASGKGGSSGGGSINIFTNQDSGVTNPRDDINALYNSIVGDYDVTGGASTSNGGKGGSGTLSIGKIKDGHYYDLKDIISMDKEELKNSMYTRVQGDSILSILNTDLDKEYYIFEVNGKNYKVHLYVLEGNQTITADTQYGNENDCASGSTAEDMAEHMVIVKVKGDYTVNSGVKVEPYYHDKYGGPKGFLLYVTGTLTNNGEINNNHGAYAMGQDVYLWKNNDGTYETVPEEGAAGGTPVTSKAGNPGDNGSTKGPRATGGGGAGGGYNSLGGTGAAGTSYSGGSAGGAGGRTTGGNASAYGGPGGDAKASNSSQYGGGGAGNPGGVHTYGTSYNGSNGTGGLLVIYANEVINSDKITANGSNGGAGADSSGGSSGGGSVNIFYYSNMTNNGTITATGGTQNNAIAGGKGGDGTVTYTQISTLLGAHTSIPNDKTLGSASVGEITRQTIVNAPKITLNNTDLSESKLVSIKYLEGKIGEYSLDLGNTWVEYTGEMEITENTIILARTKDENGNIISSSSMSITKIKKEEPQEDNTPPVDTPIVDEPVVVPSEPNDPEIDNNTSEEGDTNE